MIEYTYRMSERDDGQYQIVSYAKLPSGKIVPTLLLVGSKEDCQWHWDHWIDGC